MEVSRQTTGSRTNGAAMQALRGRIGALSIVEDLIAEGVLMADAPVCTYTIHGLTGTEAEIIAVALSKSHTELGSKDYLNGTDWQASADAIKRAIFKRTRAS